MLKTLQVPDPHRLVAIEARHSRGEPAALPRSVFEALTARQRSLIAVTGVLGGALISADADGAVHQAVVDGVTADFFDVLAASPVAGRVLASSDHGGGGARRSRHTPRACGTLHDRRDHADVGLTPC